MATSNRWEYKVVLVKPSIFKEKLRASIEAELTSLGSAGWELVGSPTTSPGANVYLYFKRPRH